jgi:hypothetical protein
MNKLFKHLLTIVLFCHAFQTNAQEWESYVPFYSKGLWGYSDTSGKIKVKPFSRNMLDFFDEYGFAKITDSTGKIGLINTTLKVIVKPKYKDIRVVHGYYIVTENTESNYELLNTSGVPLLPASYEKIEFTEFKSRYVFVYDWDRSIKVYLQDFKTGKLNKIRTYEEANEIKFKESFDFVLNNQYYVIYFNDRTKETYNLVTGKVKDGNYENDDLIARGDPWGIGNADDSPPVPSMGRDKHNFDSSRYVSKPLLNSSIRVESAQPCYYNPGLSKVKVNGKWGIMSQNRRVIVPIIYDTILMEHYYGYYYSSDYDRRTLLWICKKDGKLGMLSTDSSLNVPFIYNSLMMFGAEYFLSKTADGYGVVNVYGKVLVPNEVDSFKYASGGLDWHRCNNELILFAVKDNRYALYGTSGRKTAYDFDKLDDLTLEYAEGWFSYHEALVLKNGGYYGFAFCNNGGFILVPCEFSDYYNCNKQIGSKHFLRVKTSDGVWIVIDDTGRQYIN